MKRNLLIGAFLVAGSLLTACGGYGGGYYAQYAPPAPRYRVIGVAPGPGYVWTNGYWDWRGNNWRWTEGRWMRPPHRGAMYVAPEWRHEGRGYRLHRGYWR